MSLYGNKQAMENLKYSNQLASFRIKNIAENKKNILQYTRMLYGVSLVLIRLSSSMILHPSFPLI